jgi:hypothetical protein
LVSAHHAHAAFRGQKLRFVCLNVSTSVLLNAAIKAFPVI